MDRFGEIPINPDAQRDEPVRQGREPEGPPGVPDAVTSPEPAPAAELLEPDQAGPAAGVAPVSPVEEEAAGRGAATFSRPPRSRPPGKKKAGGGRLALRLAAWLLGVPLILVLLYTAGSTLFVPYYIKGPLARSMGQRLERPVEISRAVFSPFTLRLLVEDIVIGPGGNDPAGVRFLECATIACRIVPDRIFSGILICEGVRVSDLLMRINRADAMASDLDALWRLVVPTASPTRRTLWPDWLLPGEISLTGGTVLVDDSAAGKQYRIEQIELYLPPPDPTQAAGERLPRLSALINDSPVQVEAVRGKGSNGQAETRFDLKITSLVLANFLQALPVADQQLRLAEGRADLELGIIFPQTGSGGQRVLLEGSSSLAAVKIVDSEGKDVFTAPSARLEFRIAPLAQRYRFPQVTLENPVLHLVAGAGQDKQHALTLSELGSVLQTPLRLPLNLGIDRLQATGGQLHVALPGAAGKKLSWKDVSFNLEHFTSPGVSLEEKKAGPARFTFGMADSTGSNPAKLSGEGEILGDNSIKGSLALEQLDVVRYQDLLPRTGLGLAQGRGDLRFAFELAKPLPADREGNHFFRLHEGELSLTDYVLNNGRKKAAAGGTLRCSDMQAEPAERTLSCASLEIADSDLLNPLPLAAVLGKPAQGETWRLDARELRVKGSRLHVPLLQAFCSAGNDLVLKNFTAEARDLAGENPADNVSAQASLGAKGSVKVKGGYSLAQNRGSLQIDLQQLDFALFDPCLSQAVIPRVRQGSVNIQGHVALPSREFAGQASVGNMAAGEENGPSVSWKLATSDRLTLSADPLKLDLGEIKVRKPVLQPGLLDSENLIDNFLLQGKPAFRKLAISKISIDEGQLAPIWPILLPGYQPRLEGISGSLSGLGKKAMPFALSGKVSGLGEFTVSGKTGMEAVEGYSLAVEAAGLSPFTDFFLTSMGMSVESARGKWQQTMAQAENGRRLETEISFQGLQPVAESPLLFITSLMVGPKGVLQLASKDEVPAGTEPPFLLTSVQHELQRQGIRADISEELVLREFFPELQLPAGISFAPGLAAPLSTEGLADYKALFELRPYLALELNAVIDAATDQEALRQILQKEADLQREAENSRRASLRKQRQEREKQRMTEARTGNTDIVSEKISPEELAGDLEPLPPVQVVVTEAMLAELGAKRLHAVQGHLQGELGLDPARLRAGEGFSNGPPQVRLQLVPHLAGEDS